MSRFVLENLSFCGQASLLSAVKMPAISPKFLNLPTQIGQMRLIYDATGCKWFKHGEFGVTGYA